MIYCFVCPLYLYSPLCAAITFQRFYYLIVGAGRGALKVGPNDRKLCRRHIILVNIKNKMFISVAEGDLQTRFELACPDMTLQGKALKNAEMYKRANYRNSVNFLTP